MNTIEKKNTVSDQNIEFRICTPNSDDFTAIKLGPEDSARVRKMAQAQGITIGEACQSLLDRGLTTMLPAMA